MENRSGALEMAHLTWPEAKEVMASGRPAVLPLGSLEQHGPHLPLNTDIVMAEAVARRVADRVGGLLLPVVPFGQVWSARNFPGTMSLSPETIKAVVRDLCRSLHRQRVRLVVIITGHMGNTIPVQEAQREVQEEIPSLKTLFFNYPRAATVAKGVTESPMWKGTRFHADEIETSLMLAVAPELCHMDRAVADYPEVPTEFDFSPMSWDQITETGVFGDARPATAEKGRILLDRWVDLMVGVIEETSERLKAESSAEPR